MTPHVYVQCDLEDGELLRDWHRKPRQRSRWQRFVRWLNRRPA